MDLSISKFARLVGLAAKSTPFRLVATNPSNIGLLKYASAGHMLRCDMA